jgi:putative ATP-binding cassette transporter
MDLRGSSLYRLYIEQDKDTWTQVVFAAVVAGLMQGGMVVVINDAGAALASGGLNVRHALLFLLLLGAYSLASHFSASRTVLLAERATFAAYVGVVAKLRRMKLFEFERLGKARIYSTLHTNTDIVSETSKSLASVGAAVVMVAVSGVYVAIISPLALAVVVFFYLFGYFVYATNFKRAQTLLDATATLEKRFKDRFTYFVEAFKELKVNRRLSGVLFEEKVLPDAAEAEKSRVKTENALSMNIVFVQSYYYFMVASMLFLLPRVTPLETGDILKVAVVMLFTYGSMNRIVFWIPLFLKTEKAVENLHLLPAAARRARRRR